VIFVFLLSGRILIYADAVIVCDELEYDDEKIKDTLSNPVVIFEVLSKDEDVVRKLMYYMQIESLKQYIMIDSQKVYVRIITKREKEGTWKLEEFQTLKDKIFIEPINFEISVDVLYSGVEF
jgi:Uma2 family endonuclease